MSVTFVFVHGREVLENRVYGFTTVVLSSPTYWCRMWHLWNNDSPITVRRRFGTILDVDMRFSHSVLPSNLGSFVIFDGVLSEKPSVSRLTLYRNVIDECSESTWVEDPSRVPQDGSESSRHQVRNGYTGYTYTRSNSPGPYFDEGGKSNRSPCTK